MATKEKKTAAELEELIITEFRKRPELRNILSVIVNYQRPTGQHGNATVFPMMRQRRVGSLPTR